jgi:hypothetical protein
MPSLDLKLCFPLQTYVAGTVVAVTIGKHFDGVAWQLTLPIVGVDTLAEPEEQPLSNTGTNRLTRIRTLTEELLTIAILMAFPCSSSEC